MDDVIDLLGQLGFSEYEARAYVQLLQQNPLNGYALAKASGIPRANIYAVLQKLEDRGAVIPVETANGNTYTPVPPGELIRQLGDRFEGVLRAAERLLEQVTHPADHQYVLNIQGYPPLLEHARDLVNRAECDLMVALWGSEAQALAPAIARAVGRGLKMTTLCLQGCPETCGGCRGDVYRYHMTANRTGHWLIVIRDQTEMLIGTTGYEAVAVRTRQPHLIELAGWHIRHSITLAAMLSDMGGELEQLLKPETRALLASIGQGGSWLEYLLGLLRA